MFVPLLQLCLSHGSGRTHPGAAHGIGVGAELADQVQSPPQAKLKRGKTDGPRKLHYEAEGQGAGAIAEDERRQGPGRRSTDGRGDGGAGRRHRAQDPPPTHSGNSPTRTTIYEVDRSYVFFLATKDVGIVQMLAASASALPASRPRGRDCACWMVAPCPARDSTRCADQTLSTWRRILS